MQAVRPPDVPPSATAKTDYSSIGAALLRNEAIGPVRIGAKADDVVRLLGAPETRSQTAVSEVDAREHQQWIYTKRGLVLDMVSAHGRPRVAMITVGGPCQLKTKRGIGIGASQDSVAEAYAVEIDPSSNNPRTIVAGTVYGGLIFGLEKGRVTSIVLGAVAE